MTGTLRAGLLAAAALALTTTVAFRSAERAAAARVSVRAPAASDVSRPLAELAAAAARRACGGECEGSPAGTGGASSAGAASVGAGLAPRPASVEQTTMGARPALPVLESFDGHGVGLVGPHGTGRGTNPSDNSLAIGPNHIFETVNSLSAVYTKKGDLFDRSGTVLFGPIAHNVIWSGFGGECERTPNGDTVVRYDQLADRWLIVMPRFNRAPPPAGSPAGTPPGPYGMCYAISTGPNPLGPYYRYYFERELFPDYPRPAVWPDGYYNPTSSSDNRLPDGSLPEKHACVLDRTKALQGLAATEQCLVIRFPNFLNNADIDGQGLPPAGAPNLIMAAGGAQLDSIFTADAIYFWKFHVDWEDPSRTRLEGPEKITVAPYNYLCNGQLTRCVPQKDSDVRIDAQGDKIMQRLVYRNVDDRESIVAVHSVDTEAGGGGVRWYEFRLDGDRQPVLHQQGTYAPDAGYRWMASPAMDRQGNIGMGYSYGGPGLFPGQRFAARLADDPPGQLTFQESVLVHGQAPSPVMRWQDYTTTAMDPTDDCTMWYQGDYIREGASSYTVRIGAFRVPGCLRGTASGAAFFDANRNGMRDANEVGLEGVRIEHAGNAQQPGAPLPASGTRTTAASGEFRVALPADPAYADPTYTVTAHAPLRGSWTRIDTGTGYWSGGTVPMANGGYTFRLRDRDDVTRLDFGFACTARNTGGSTAAHWLGSAGRNVLRANDEGPEEAARPLGRRGPAGWRGLLGQLSHLVDADGARFTVTGTFDEAYGQLGAWLRGDAGSSARARVSRQLAVASLNVAYGTQDGGASVQDPIVGDWVTVSTLLPRVSAAIAEPAAAATLEAYRTLLEGLNTNRATVTPATPAGCAEAFRP